MADELKPEDIGLHNLKPADGSRKDRKRIGRGHGSGHGKTSGRGHKGYGSRSGAKQRTRFEGGQNPLHMRMRKLRGLSVNAVLGLSSGVKVVEQDEAPAEAEAEAPAAAEAEADAPATEETPA